MAIFWIEQMIKGVKSPLFWLILLIVGVPCLKEGMFFDGLTYASIARNLAIGVGTPWSPHYTATLYPQFFEHPPLMFWVQSLFFRLLGNSVFIEKAFSFLIFSLNIFFIYLLISEMRIAKNKKDIKFIFKWSAAGFLLSKPVLWGASYNLLDSLLCVFTLAATTAFTRGFHKKNRHFYFLGLTLIWFGFLTKGPVAFFPLVVVPIWILVSSKDLGLVLKIKRASVNLVVLLAGLSLLLGILFVLPNAEKNITQYIQTHLLAAVKGNFNVLEGVNPLSWMFKELLVALGHLIILFLIASLIYIPRRVKSFYKKDFIFLLALGLCASVPMVVSSKLRSFYLIPSIPFFSVAGALFIRSLFENKFRVFFKPFKLKEIVCVILISATAINFIHSKTHRDSELVKLMKAPSLIPFRGKTITTCKSLLKDYKLIAYLQRYHRISLKKSEDHILMLSSKSCGRINDGGYKFNL